MRAILKTLFIIFTMTLTFILALYIDWVMNKTEWRSFRWIVNGIVITVCCIVISKIAEKIKKGE